jgi:Rod binding domain-containing protein
MIREVQVEQSGEVRGEQKPPVEKVVESFEMIFVSELVRGLREAFAKELGEAGGPGKDIYAAWIDQALSEAIVRGGGIGLQEVLKEWVEPASEGLSPGKSEVQGSRIPDAGPVSKVFRAKADKL